MARRHPNHYLALLIATGGAAGCAEPSLVEPGAVPDGRLAALAAPVLLARQSSGPSFVGQDLGILPGDNQSVAFGVNNAGEVVGQSAGTSGAHAFYWNGALQNLTTPGSQGAAYAIGSGATAFAVGYERAPGQPSRAVVWTLPSITAVDLDQVSSVASGVNDAGTVVGSYCVSGCGVNQVSHGAIWVVGVSGRTAIAPLPGYDFAHATDVNNDGLVVGSSSGPVATSERAFLRLVNGVLIDLPPLAGFSQSSAVAISDVAGGQVYVAGFSRDAAGTTRGMRWTINASTGAILETADPDQRYSLGVNLVGDVAGSGGSLSKSSATLWRSGGHIALNAPRGGSGSFSRGMARGAGTPTYVVGETTVKSRPRALRWVVQ